MGCIPGPGSLEKEFWLEVKADEEARIKYLASDVATLHRMYEKNKSDEELEVIISVLIYQEEELMRHVKRLWKHAKENSDRLEKLRWSGQDS